MCWKTARESVWLYLCASVGWSCPAVSGVSGGCWVQQELSGRGLPDSHHALAAQRMLVLPLHSLSVRSAQANWPLESRCSFPWILYISCSIVITASLLLARISEKVLKVSNEFLLESSAHKLLIMVISWLLERLSNSSSSVGSDWTGASSAGGWCWANSTSSVIPARPFDDAVWSRSRCFHAGR